MRFKSVFRGQKCVGVKNVGAEPVKRSSRYFFGRNDQRFLSVFVFDYHFHAGIWERVFISLISNNGNKISFRITKIMGGSTQPKLNHTLEMYKVFASALKNIFTKTN